MPKFVKLAQKFNAIPEFWALRLVENTKIGREFEKYSIIDKNHKKHKDFIKMINKPIFKSENIRLYPEIKELIK
jgi:hypothetical protein